MTQSIKNFGARAAGTAVLFATSAQFVLAAPGDCSESDVTTGGIGAGVNCTKPAQTPSNLFGNGSIFQIIANTLIFLVGAISVIMLIIGGLRYVLSSGEATAVKGAKDTILYAIIGIIVAILAFAAVSFVVGRFAATSS